MTEVAASARGERDWLEIPGPLIDEAGVVRLHEPADSDVASLLDQLRRNEYPRPFVVDDGGVRRLHFSLDYVQSEMSLQDPDALNFDYTRRMMAFLLFVPRPRHVVVVGLGGGSLTRFCYRQLPQARVTTVEIDADVIAFRRWFELPLDDTRMRIVHADAAAYFAVEEDPADVVLIDGCDRHGVAPAFCDERFYQNLYDRLQPRGMIVMNLIGAAQGVRTHLRLIAGIFGGRVIVQRIRPGGNRLVFAFKHPSFVLRWPSLEREAQRLARLHRLDFPRFVSKLRSSHQWEWGGATVAG